MATFAELKSNVSKELGLDETAAGNEDTLIGRRLNEAVRQFLLQTHCRVAASTTTLTANVKDYELDSTTLAMHNVIDASSRKMFRVSPEEIHELRESTTSSGSIISRYAVDGGNLFMIWPTPATATTLTIYHVPKPTEMSSAANDPSSTTYGGIPVEFHYILEYWALWKMASYDDDQSSQMGETYRKLWESGCMQVRAELRKRGGRKLSRARVGRGARRYKIHPSEDV